MKLIIVISVALPLLSWGQGNLVPNGSFEEFDHCPHGPDQLFLSHHWHNPNAGSPDYFHSCNPPLIYVFGPDTVILPHLGVPANAFGYQHAHSGQAYAGIYCFSKYQAELREYLQIQLTDSIFPSVRYLVNFYVSFADNGRYSINTIGAFLSKEPIFQDDVYRFDVEPQVLNTSDNPLTSKEDWVLITDTFSSRYGGERYLTIGNFNTDATSDTLYHFSGDTSGIYAYYYIDDVSVVAIDSIPSGVIEDEMGNRIFKVYPNPNSGHLTLEYVLQQNETGILSVFNLVGGLIHQQQLAPTTEAMKIDLSMLGNGLYLLSVDVSGEQRFTERVTIMKE
jgi:hypothetical protein